MERVASETAEERERRLSVRTNLAERIGNERVQEREERFEVARESVREKTAAKSD